MFRAALIVLAFSSLSLKSLQAQDDPVGESLSKAKVEFQEKENVFRSGIIKRLQTAETKANRAGKESSVGRIKAERPGLRAGRQAPEIGANR